MSKLKPKTNIYYSSIKSLATQGSYEGSTIFPLDTQKYEFVDLFTSTGELSPDCKHDEDFFGEDDISLKRPGKSMVMCKPKVIRILSPYLSEDIKESYEKSGPFHYKRTDLDHLNLNEDNLEVRGLCCIRDGDPSSASIRAKKKTTNIASVCSEFYIGEWNKISNKPEGRGVAYYKDKALYEGFWKDGKQNGKGKVLYPNGQVYQGDWKNGVIDGYGIFMSPISNETGNYTEKIKGHWKEGNAHGDGYQILSDGCTYRGDFINSVKSGKGKFEWPDGKSYYGDVKDNQIHGKGQYKYKDGRRYIGDFKRNKMHGMGVYIWPDGQRYEGQFNKDRRSGYGILKLANGKEFEGKWKRGKFLLDDEFVDIEQLQRTTPKKKNKKNKKKLTKTIS